MYMQLKIGLCAKVCMGLYGGFVKKISCNSGAAPRRTRIRQDFAVRDGPRPIRAFASGRPWESKVTYCCLEQNRSSW